MQLSLDNPCADFSQYGPNICEALEYVRVCFITPDAALQSFRQDGATIKLGEIAARDYINCEAGPELELVKTHLSTAVEGDPR